MRLFGLNLSVVAATAVLLGCSPGQIAQPGSTTPAASSVSWDGTYHGTVQITGLGSGMQQRWCETEPNMVIHVTRNAFQYAMPHPNAPDNPTPVYSATIAPDGTFNSQLDSGLMMGRVTGSHIAGTIKGSLCDYAFSMDRS